MKEKLQRAAAYLITAAVVAFGGYIVGTRTAAQQIKAPVSSVEVGSQKNAYDSGYDKGLAEGQKSGYETGFSDGREEGYLAGYEAGKSESVALLGSETPSGELPDRSAPEQESGTLNEETEGGTESPPEEKTGAVYVTKTGKKYHRSGCSSLSKSKIEISLAEAKQRGYTPCSNCKP